MSEHRFVPWDESGSCSECGKEMFVSNELSDHIMKEHTKDPKILKRIYTKSRGCYYDERKIKVKCGEVGCKRNATSFVISYSRKDKRFTYRFCFRHWKEVYLEHDLQKPAFIPSMYDLMIFGSALDFWIHKHAFHASQAQIELSKNIKKAKKRFEENKTC